MDIWELSAIWLFISGISGMPIPPFLLADLVEGLAEVFARKRRAIYFLEFILQHWN